MTRTPGGPRPAISPVVLIAGAILAWGGRVALAQELEPRRWTRLPVGTNIAGIGALFTEGGLHFGPVTQIDDAQVEMYSVPGSYHHYFALADLTARVDVLVPFQTGRWDGLLSGVPLVL